MEVTVRISLLPCKKGMNRNRDKEGRKMCNCRFCFTSSITPEQPMPAIERPTMANHGGSREGCGLAYYEKGCSGNEEETSFPLNIYTSTSRDIYPPTSHSTLSASLILVHSDADDQYLNDGPEPLAVVSTDCARRDPPSWCPPTADSVADVCHAYLAIAGRKTGRKRSGSSRCGLAGEDRGREQREYPGRWRGCVAASACGLGQRWCRGWFPVGC